MTAPKKAKQPLMAIITIEHIDLIMPTADALKLVDVLTRARKCRLMDYRGAIIKVGDLPLVELKQLSDRSKLVDDVEIDQDPN